MQISSPEYILKNLSSLSTFNIKYIFFRKIYYNYIKYTIFYNNFGYLAKVLYQRTIYRNPAKPNAKGLVDILFEGTTAFFVRLNIYVL